LHHEIRTVAGQINVHNAVEIQQKRLPALGVSYCRYWNLAAPEIGAPLHCVGRDLLNTYDLGHQKTELSPLGIVSVKPPEPTTLTIMLILTMDSLTPPYEISVVG